MATFMVSSFLLLFLCCATTSTLVTSSEQVNDYLISSHIMSRAAVEKQSHFRFYWHDMISGSNRTAVSVAQAPQFNKSSTFFSDVFVMDDPLRTGPEKNSKLVGKAQGIYVAAGLNKLELLMAMNFVFTDGEYNGSTISILGHNEVFTTVREMPIVGGSGLFRFARGYVQFRTYLFNQKIGYAVVEYKVFVNHY
ncbi:Dirigent protein [Rhynchospora pubera]|uniref:Dirigent protein n=1 Tax=Rhynchospora pubera TaxID=906938 RepID=A0AAV8GGD8_9POAL|nr:Dirigent protein [Rhynchospora pubera]